MSYAVYTQRQDSENETVMQSVGVDDYGSVEVGLGGSWDKDHSGDTGLQRQVLPMSSSSRSGWSMLVRWSSGMLS